MEIVYKDDICEELYKALCFCGGDTVEYIMLTEKEFDDLIRGWQYYDNELCNGEEFCFNEEEMILTVGDEDESYDYVIRVDLP
tara:strand:- start:124 stop:372 length:249 start_codon:yes stop_codon:yes gene_type:complete